jgi:hypothetical protein
MATPGVYFAMGWRKAALLKMCRPSLPILTHYELGSENYEEDLFYSSV